MLAVGHILVFPRAALPDGGKRRFDFDGVVTVSERARRRRSATLGQSSVHRRVAGVAGLFRRRDRNPPLGRVGQAAIGSCRGGNIFESSIAPALLDGADSRPRLRAVKRDELNCD
ncbi:MULTISPECIES: hypothetical protein [Lysobacter]|uniref:Uncharacterized protein n=1 Tax=Lysobacter firmicutimachus TaxID=1792846 RepID=A0ABU8D467_9GAMM|nr:hypothetical protein [Lysobacter antibioticus]